MTREISDAEIERLLSRWTGGGLGPGCAIAVLREGKVENTLCLGLASIEHRVPIRSNTVFRIASVTKQFLSAAVLLLADEGRVELDAPLGTYLPELSGEPAGATVRQAMQNISGIRDSLELLALSGGGLAVPHKVLESFRLSAGQRTTNFPPGSSYLYSNANFLLLTIIVERVSGRSLAEILDESFFRPLGMTSTRLVSQHHEVIDNFATGYIARPEGSFEKGQMTMALSGEGGMVSTLEDMILWLQYYREDPKGLIARLATPAQFNNGRTGHYGLGLACETYRGLKSIGHTGLWPGYRTEIVWFPEADVSIACLANVNEIDPHSTNREIADAVIGDDFPIPALTELAPDIRKSAITASPFIDPAALEVIEFTEDGNGDLTAVLHGASTAVAAESPTRICIKRGSCEFSGVDLSGLADGVIRMTWVNGQETKLISAAKLPPARPDLAEYVGTYYWDEIDAGIQVGLDGDTLNATILGRYTDTPQWTLTPRAEDVMTMDDNSGPWPRRLVLGFQRDSSGRIGGLLVNGGRVKRIPYRRRDA